MKGTGLMSEDTELLRRFVDTFDGFDRHLSSTAEGDVAPLLVEPWDEDGWSEWRVVPADLRPDALQSFYADVPGPLPPLHERLILSYRWAQIDVDRLTLFGNLPPGLSGLAAAITRDEGLFEALAPIKCVQFGRGTDMDYDPVCFDLRRRDANGDCRRDVRS